LATGGRRTADSGTADGWLRGASRGQPDDMPVKLDVDVRPTEDIAGQKETLSIDGQADISGAKLKFEGLASKDTEGPIVKGNIRADIKDLQGLGKLFQAFLPALPPITFAADGAASGQRINVDELNVSMGNSLLTGKFEPDMGAKRPKIKGTLSAKLIDIAELKGNGKKTVDKTEGPSPGNRLIPAEPIAFPPLDMADINLTISIEKLNPWQKKAWASEPICCQTSYASGAPWQIHKRKSIPRASPKRPFYVE
jgi:hypothetical protein